MNTHNTSLSLRPVSIREWPASERPRERLMEHGPQALTDGELLAVVIGCGHRGRNALDLARQVLTVFGSLRDFLNADPGKCLDQAGIGPARYAALQAALELARRHHRAADLTGAELSAPAVTHEFLVATLRDKPYELFCCLYLDGKHRLIAFEELFRGTFDTTSVHSREIVRQALNHNAQGIILAHNHPSGDPEPSYADRLLTGRLKDVLGQVGVRIVDHIVVGGRRCFSFADCGLL